jgi:phosphinothricin acetyltransferase
MRLRNATLQDLEAIVMIYNSTIPKRVATADTAPVSVESRRAWLTERSESRPVWVAEPEEAAIPGEMAGWISLGEFHTRPAYHATAEVAVYISEDWRGEGVGKLLVGEAMRLGTGLGIKTLIAGVFAHNEASLGLFEGLGFSRWAHLPGVAELDGVERDLVYLGLRLC